MTVDEMREAFLDQLDGLANYWATIPNPACGSGETEAQARVRGLAFSVLVMLDGGSLGVPAFDLVPAPHLEDAEFHRDEGGDWWTPEVINDCQLHEEWCARGRKK
jgi:hypothetical protein